VSLRCGAVARAITPAPGLPMGGYAARTGVAEGTLDPLFCRSVVFSDDATTVALVVLDLLYVSAAWAEPVRRQIAALLRCDPANVLIAATHTHAGPDVFQPGGASSATLLAYQADLAAILRDTVSAAHAERVPASVHFGSTRVDGVAANRREAGGPVDDTLHVLVARAASGAALAVVAVFGCHPTVLPPANLRYSRDLFGAAVDDAQHALGGHVLLFNGAAADVSTRFTRRAPDTHEVARLGRAVGEAIAVAANGATPIASTPLCAGVEHLPIEPRRLPTPAEAERVVAEAATRLEALRAQAAPAGEQRGAAANLEGALAQLFLTTHGGAKGLLGYDPQRAVIQHLRIGECDIVTAPGELFSESGRQVRARRSRPTLLIGYANDYLGYFVEPPAAVSGGYEALIAFVAPTSAAGVAQRLATIDCSERIPA
jgi:neutral/alkaline ceramidase-like enzyme